MTTSELTHRLFRKYGTSENATNEKYIVATQVRSMGSHIDRTADAVIVGNWPSAGYEIQGFEIKVSRADWLNEVRSPGKCDAVKKYCDRWWLLISSTAFVKEGELPDDWGLMIPSGSGLRIVKDAPKLDPVFPTVPFITGLMRANKRAHIPEDLHSQYIQDEKRKIESKLKKEYDDLKQFVKFIKEAFGIELAQDKRWSSAEMGYEKYWVAKVRNKWSTYSPEELKTLIEASLSGDLQDIEYRLGQAQDDAERALESLSKYKSKKPW